VSSNHLERDSFIVPPEAKGDRVDRLSTIYLSNFSRPLASDFRTIFSINGVRVKKGKVANPGDRVEVEWWIEEAKALSGEPIPLEIIWEDESIALINKSAGLVVHPAAGNSHGTLLNGLIYHYGGEFFGTGEWERNGIVHRLDKETSGILVVAKTLEAQTSLLAQFKGRSVEKGYTAIVRGRLLPMQGVIDEPIGRDPRSRQRYKVSEEGRASYSEFRVLRHYGSTTLVHLNLVTGRTHQLRVHLKHIGFPIVGDTLYGGRNEQLPMLLHATQITFNHPLTAERLTFRAPLPATFKEFLSSDRE
jgi:23S rRNA pseudouridine1911/1915/1917 synthase